MPDKHSDTDEVRHNIHMKMLSKSDSAKDLGELTVVPIGFAVSIALELLTSEKRKLLLNLKDKKDFYLWSHASGQDVVEAVRLSIINEFLEQLGEL